MPPPGKRELEFCKAMFGCSNDHGTLWLETVDVLDARTPLHNDKLSLIPHNFHMVLEMFTYLTLLFHQPRNKLCFTKNHMGFLHISNIYWMFWEHNCHVYLSACNRNQHSQVRIIHEGLIYKMTNFKEADRCAEARWDMTDSRPGSSTAVTTTISRVWREARLLETERRENVAGWAEYHRDH